MGARHKVQWGEGVREPVRGGLKGSCSDKLPRAQRHRKDVAKMLSANLLHTTSHVAQNLRPLNFRYIADPSDAWCATHEQCPRPRPRPP